MEQDICNIVDAPDIHGKTRIIHRQFRIKQKDKEIDRHIDPQSRHYPKIRLPSADLQIFLYLIKIILQTIEQQQSRLHRQQPAAQVLIVEKLLIPPEIDQHKPDKEQDPRPFHPPQERL